MIASGIKRIGTGTRKFNDVNLRCLHADMAGGVLICRHSTAQLCITGIELAEMNVISKIMSLFGEKYASLRESIISIKDENCSGFAAFKRAIEEGQESGILRKDDSFQRTIILWSMLHGFSSLLIDGFMDVDKIYEELFEKMFQDMLAITVAGKVKLLSNLPFADSLLKPNA